MWQQLLCMGKFFVWQLGKIFCPWQKLNISVIINYC